MVYRLVLKSIRFETEFTILQSEHSSTSEFEKNTVAHIQSLKADLIQMQSLQSQLLEYQTLIAKLQEGNLFKDKQISEVQQRLARVEEERQTLRQDLIRSEQQVALFNSSKRPEVEALEVELQAEREKLKKRLEEDRSLRSKLQNMEESVASKEAVITKLTAEKIDADQTVILC